MAFLGSPDGFKVQAKWPSPVGDTMRLDRSYVYLVGGVEHEFYFSIYWECHHPN